MTEAVLTGDVDNVDGGEVVGAEGGGHVQCLVGVGWVAQLILVRVQTLLRADRVEDLRECRPWTNPHHHLLRVRQVHRETLSDL